MKKSLLFIILFSITLSLSAQGLVLTETDTIEMDITYQVADIYQSTTYLKNTSNTDITVQWDLQDASNTLVTGWSNGFCNNEVCVDMGFATSGQFVVPADDSVAVKAQVGPNDIDGSTVWVITLMDVNNMMDTHTLIFDISMTKDVANSIRDIDVKTMVISPNPATSEIQIASNDLNNFNGAVRIYNVIGKEVLTTSFSKEININNLQEGLYFVQIFDEKSNAKYVQTFVKK